MAVRSTAARTGADGELLLDHRPFVLKLCHILLRNPADADDAAQQVFLHAYHALDKGVRPVNPRAWLAEIARNECRSRGRRAAARPEAPLPETVAADGPDPADRAAEHALMEQLQQELAELPDRQREAVLLREFRGLSYNEIAAELDETGPAVESLLQRARRRLVERLEGVRRPLVGVTFAIDWARKALARMLPGDAGVDAATAGGTAVVIAKLAAVSAVAVSVGAATSGRPAADAHAAQHRAVKAAKSPVAFSPARQQPHRSFRPVPDRKESASVGRSSRETRAEETVSSGASEPSSGASATSSSDSGSSGSGSSGSGSSGSSSSGSGSLSSGPGDGLSGSASTGSSGSSGTSHSGSDGSGSSGPGPSGSGSSGTSGHDEPETSSSHG